MRRGVIFVASVLVSGFLVGCGFFGSNEESSDVPDDSVAALWHGEYEGRGTETDYRGRFADSPVEIEPTLAVAFRDSQVLRTLSLSWEDGGTENVARTDGSPRRLSGDSLVTTVEVAEEDSFTTRFHFELHRDSSVIDGVLRQRYGNTEAADSTVVAFTVTPVE